MKRLILAVIIGVASLSSINANAQINLSINIGSQPTWGPTGYNHVENYYLPDIDAYYNVPAKMYTYQVNGQWVNRNTLPSRYSGYDLYSGYKVVINRPKPYMNHAQDVRQYSKFKNYRGKQEMIRDNRDKRYDESRKNIGSRPNERDHNNGRGNNGNGRGNGKDGRDQNNGRDHRDNRN